MIRGKKSPEDDYSSGLNAFLISQKK